MPVAWRIVKGRHAGSAFSGEGAASYGGRWNSRGVRMVYASATRSLAVLETLVHLNPILVFRYVMFRIEFEDGMVACRRLEDLPEGWQAEPPGEVTRTQGDAWVRAGESVVLSVPSVLVPGEPNYLLNPAHPDFGRLRISPPERFAFDPRLRR